MKLKVHNFRCHTDREWTFPDNGLCLLNGARGQGKTTILEAISYAFYGSNMVKKPCTFKTNKSTVVLEIGPLKIKRSSKPRRVDVFDAETNKNYEGDEAQMIIENWLGMDVNGFKYCCYISQKSDGGILGLGPTDQLNFIENLALKDNMHREIQNKIKAQLKEVEEKLNIASRDASVQEKLLEECVKQVEGCSIKRCPIKSDKKHVFSKDTIKKIDDEKVNLEVELARCREEYSSFSKELESIKQLKDQIEEKILRKQTIESTANRIKRDLNSLKETILSPEQVLEMETKSTTITESISLTKNYDLLETKKAELDKLLTETKTEIENELTEIKADLEEFDDEETLEESIQNSTTEAPLYTKKEAVIEAKQLISKLKIPKEVKTIDGVIKILTEKITKLTEQYKLLNDGLHVLNIELGTCKITSKCYHCPGCNIELKIDNNELVATNNDTIVDKQNQILEEIEEVENQMKEKLSLKEDYLDHVDKFKEFARCIAEKKQYVSAKELKMLRDDLEQVIGLKSRQKALISKLENLTSSTTFIRLKSDISKLEKDIPKDYTRLDIHQLESELQVITKSLTIYYEALPKITCLTQELQAKTKELNGINRVLSQKNYDTSSIKVLENNMAATREKIDNFTASISNLYETRQKCTEYYNYLCIKNRMNRAKKEFDAKKEIETELEGKIRLLLKLKTMAFEAEYVAIQQAIEDINHHSEQWLEMMFDNDPINVRLDSIKETLNGKKSKLQMNTELRYKGHKYDTINSLSGGERDQVNLAFVLGVNSMLGGKLLMLDECLASLDTDTNSETLTLLKEYSNKPVIIISHEMNHGIFDSKINI
jgi:exonuclease SbcC